MNYQKIISIINKRKTILYILLISLMIVVGCVRVISTYQVYWQTWDEPAHIAAGLQWLTQGRYTFDWTHPPFARVMSAIGLHFQGFRVNEDAETYEDMWVEGNRILHEDGRYERNLTFARLGILPFFVLASLVVALWSKNVSGLFTSLISTLLFTTTPLLLAHAGIAALDIASMATIALALFLFSMWLAKPTILRSILLGCSVGLAIITKFTALIFIPAIFTIALIIHIFPHVRNWVKDKKPFPHKKLWIRSAAFVIFLCSLTIWAGYRFSTSPLTNLENKPYEPIDRIVGTSGFLHDASYFIAEKIPLPAPEFFNSIANFVARNEAGHLAYFLGEIRQHGWIHYYPVVFSLKTPLPFLIF